MRLNRTTYNAAGELMAPPPGDLTAHFPYPGGMPSTDTGYYHRFVFNAVTEAERLQKSRRFFALMDDVPGFSTLRLKPYEVRVGNFLRFGLDIVYVVEDPDVR